MSVDVSPDGRLVVFDLLGDLYSVPTSGGPARRLTAGVAYDEQPRFSPDGRQLAFLSDRGGSQNLWIADAEGRHPRQLSRLRGHVYGAVTSPTWSPDGRTVVVAQHLGATRPGVVGERRAECWLLAAYDVASGRMRWLSDTTPDGARAALGPAFDPRGDGLYAAMADVGSASPSAWRLARFELASHRIVPAMGGRVGRSGMRPTLSRDGHYLIYASASGAQVGLRVRDRRTDRERWLVREALENPPSLAEASSGDLAPGYAITPDSRSVVIAYAGRIHRIDIATGRVFTIPFVAHVAQGLGALRVQQFALPDTAVRTRSILEPALSPDGMQVAFSARDRIWVMDVADTGARGVPRRLTNDTVGEFYPSWSPDGRWIAYSTWSDLGGGAVRRAAVRTRNSPLAPPSERISTDSALYFQTAVAPDGKRVVAVRAPLPGGHTPARLEGPLGMALVWFPARGGPAHTAASLAREEHVLYHPRYPVDEVYFTADAERVFVGLESLRWDGSDRRTAFLVTGAEYWADSVDVVGVVAPDGRRAIVSRSNALFDVIAPAPTDTGRPRPAHVDLRGTRDGPDSVVPGAHHRLRTALAPWISWSRDGHRVLFSQGGSVFIGDVHPGKWINFRRMDVRLDVPPDAPSGTLVLAGARLITMRGHEVIPRGDIVVRGDRITAVGIHGQVAIPPGAHVVDVTGTTILPGYVDMHDHLFLPKGVHAQQCWQCLLDLAYGITTARDPQPMFAPDVFTYAERERSGDLLGPRVFSTGLAYWGTDPPIETRADAQEAVRPNADLFRSETFKVYYDPATGRRAWELLSAALRQARLNGTAHIENPTLATTVAIDGLTGIEHVPSTRMYDDVLTLIARSGATLTPTFGAALFGAWRNLFHRYGYPWDAPKVRRFAPPFARKFMCAWCAEPHDGPMEWGELAPLLRSAAQVVARGGRVAVGSHGNIPGIGFHYELWLYAIGGMSPYDILRSATIVGAAALGHAADLGSLEVGKLADMQVLENNPLADIRNTTSLRYVVKNGRLYQADTLAEVWPRYRALPSTWRWDSPPLGGRGVPDQVMPGRW